MHEMDKSPRILTIIGLIFEGVGAAGSFFGAWLLVNIENFPGVSPSSMELSPQDFNDMMDLMVLLGNIMYVVSIIVSIVFIVNLIIFSKLLKSNFDEATAKKVYLYQAIWGGINILFNQITGVMYLISGVTGYSGHKEEKNIRAGI